MERRGQRKEKIVSQGARARAPVVVVVGEEKLARSISPRLRGTAAFHTTRANRRQRLKRVECNLFLSAYSLSCKYMPLLLLMTGAYCTLLPCTNCLDTFPEPWRRRSLVHFGGLCQQHPVVSPKMLCEGTIS